MKATNSTYRRATNLWLFIFIIVMTITSFSILLCVQPAQFCTPVSSNISARAFLLGLLLATLIFCIDKSARHAEEGKNLNEQCEEKAVSPTCNPLAPQPFLKARLLFLWTGNVPSPVEHYFTNPIHQMKLWWAEFREQFFNKTYQYVLEQIAKGAVSHEELDVGINSNFCNAMVKYFDPNNIAETPIMFCELTEEIAKVIFQAIQEKQNYGTDWKNEIYNMITNYDILVPTHFKLPEFQSGQLTAYQSLELAKRFYYLVVERKEFLPSENEELAKTLNLKPGQVNFWFHERQIQHKYEVASIRNAKAEKLAEK